METWLSLCLISCTAFRVSISSFSHLPSTLHWFTYDPPYGVSLLRQYPDRSRKVSPLPSAPTGPGGFEHQPLKTFDSGFIVACCFQWASIIVPERRGMLS